MCLCVREWRGSACVQLYGEKGGASSGGPASPDLKRDSFIIANLQNINTRASTQAPSQGQEVTLPWMEEVRNCTSAGALFVCSDCMKTNHFRIAEGIFQVCFSFLFLSFCFFFACTYSASAWCACVRLHLMVRSAPKIRARLAVSGHRFSALCPQQPTITSFSTTATFTVTAWD